MNIPLRAPTGAAIVGTRVTLDATRQAKLWLCPFSGEIQHRDSDSLVVDWETEYPHCDALGAYVYVDDTERCWSEHDVLKATLAWAQVAPAA